MTTDQLLVRYHEDREARVLDILTERLAPLARKAARRYQRTSEPSDDLQQVALIGLVKAIQRFDPERGFAFSSLAMPTMLGELRRYFRDHTWSVHVPRSTQERAQHVRRSTGELYDRNGRAPTVGELAQELDLSIEQVVEAQLAQAGYVSSSYDAPRGSSGDDEPETLLDRLGEADDGYDRADDRESLSRVRHVLDERERAIIDWRYGDQQLTQAEVAERLNLSQMHVSRLQRRAEERLRAVLVDERQLQPA